MSTCLVAMCPHPLYLGFEQSDPLCQFVLRVRCKVFPGQLAGGVPFGAREIKVVHYR